jgi:hypothetical protein
MLLNIAGELKGLGTQSLYNMAYGAREALVSSSFGSMANAVSGVLAIGIFFYIGSKIWKNIAKNEPIEIYPLLRPFIICILISNFQGLVISPLNSITKPIVAQLNTAGIKGDNAAYSNIKSRITKARETRQATGSATDNNESNDSSWWQKLKQKAGEAANMIGSFMSYLAEFLAELLFIIMDYTGWAIRVFFKLFIIFTEQFYLSMLAFIGPIAFAVSLFPGYSSTLTNWISKYISIMFWTPIIALADVFIGYIISKYVDIYLSMTDPSGLGILVASIATGLVSLALSLYAFFIYKKAPTIASWVIQGGDTGNASSLANILGTIAGAAGAIVGMSYVRGAQAATGSASSGTAASSVTQNAAAAVGSAANSQN